MLSELPIMGSPSHRRERPKMSEDTSMIASMTACEICMMPHDGNANKKDK